MYGLFWRIFADLIQELSLMKSHLCHQPLDTQPYVYRKEIQVELASSLKTIVPDGQECRIVIRTASKLLKLNLLECSLIRWLLSHKASLQDLFDHSKGITLFQLKRDRSLLLLLLLNGYHAKSFLSNGLSNPLIDSAILDVVPKFTVIYGCWSPPADLASLSLVKLNGLFEGMTVEADEGRRDYNQMVGSILELSKTYNIGGHRSSIKQNNSQKVQKQEKDLLSELDHHSAFQYPQFLHQEMPNEDEGVCRLKVSSGKYKVRDFNMINLNESKNICDSRNNSPPSLMGSGNRQRGSIKPTYSFFDDI